MIKALTVALCAALFTLIVWIIPAQANHQPTSAPYVCTSLDAAMETVRMLQAGEEDELREMARTDKSFNCWFNSTNYKFYILELVHEYTIKGVHKGVTRVRAPDGNEVYTFGPISFINKVLHVTES